MLNTLIICFLCVSVLPELTFDLFKNNTDNDDNLEVKILTEGRLRDFAIFKDSVDTDDRYEVKIVSEEHQHLGDGLKFIVEIENKTAKTIQLKVPWQSPPFRVMVYGESFSTAIGMGFESGAYTSPRTIVLEVNSKIQFAPIVIKEYVANAQKHKLEPGRHLIIGELVFINDSEKEIKTTRHRIGPTVVYME